MGLDALRYLLDSSIVIDHFDGIEPATDFLREHGGSCALSSITRAEVLVGFDEEGKTLATNLLGIFPTLPISTTTADLAARLRRTHRWKLPDALQAAVASENDLALLRATPRIFIPTAWMF